MYNIPGQTRLMLSTVKGGTYSNPANNFSFVTAHNGSSCINQLLKINRLGDPASSALAGAIYYLVI
ncbi:MAG: hypothetical protein IPL50_19295 [Chitinophagaceae bacterium]|nr:hypothetical protein [Chitinophagaceae bacterium]